MTDRDSFHLLLVRQGIALLVDIFVSLLAETIGGAGVRVIAFHDVIGCLLHVRGRWNDFRLLEYAFLLRLRLSSLLRLLE